MQQARVLHDSIAVRESLTDWLYAKAGEVRGEGLRESLQEGQRVLERHWDSYVGSLGMSDEKISKLPGHPISGRQVVAAAGIDDVRQSQRFAGEHKGPRSGVRGLTRFTFRTFKVSALEDATSDGVTLPYWKIFNWGSGGKISDRVVLNVGRVSAPRSHPLSRGKRTDQTKSYEGKWFWYPREGIGNRGLGVIVGKTWAGSRKVEPMVDFPAGHMFEHAVDAFINRMDQFVRSGV